MPPVGLSGILKLIHIVAAIVWVGGGSFLTLYGLRLAGAEAAERTAYARSMLFAGRVFMVTSIVALAAGVWLVLAEDLWGFDQAWISIGFLGIIVGAVLGPAFYGPQSEGIISDIEKADTAAADARSSRIRLVSSVEMVILLAVVWAMVYKPGGPF